MMVRCVRMGVLYFLGVGGCKVLGEVGFMGWVGLWRVVLVFFRRGRRFGFRVFFMGVILSMNKECQEYEKSVRQMNS